MVVPFSQASTICPETDFDTFYDIGSTAQWIVDRRFARVGLQFPDALLAESTAVVSALVACMRTLPNSSISSSSECLIFVMADSSYAPCCVDRICSAHVAGDAIVHYGPACHSSPPEDAQTTPVRYVYTRQPLVLPLEIASVPIDEAIRGAVLVYDGCYEWSVGAGGASRMLAPLLPSGPIHTLEMGVTTDTNMLDACRDQPVILLLAPDTDENGRSSGSSAVVAAALLLRQVASSLHVWHPLSGAVQSLSVMRDWMRRNALMQKAKDLASFGIICGRMTSDAVQEVQSLKRLIKSRGKRCYVISVGKPNAAKLSNFADHVECFVSVGCRRAFLPQQQVASDVIRPIVTVAELLCALGDSDCVDESFTFSVMRLLPARPSAEPAVRQSLVSGRIQASGPAEDPSMAEGGSQIDRLSETSRAVLLRREFRGLEVAAPCESPSLLEEGRSGIAKGYATEPS